MLKRFLYLPLESLDLWLEKRIQLFQLAEQYSLKIAALETLFFLKKEKLYLAIPVLGHQYKAPLLDLEMILEEEIFHQEIPHLFKDGSYYKVQLKEVVY